MVPPFRVAATMNEPHIAAQGLAAHAAPRTLRARVAELLRLALPVTLSRSGMFLMGLVNTILLGHYAAAELAYQSIAQAITIPLFVAISGFILGALVLTARSMGAGNPGECGATWQRGIAYGVLLGVIAAALAMGGETVLRATGLSENLSAEGGKVVRIIALGLPFVAVYMTCAYFLEGLKRPTPAMLIMAVANVLNLALAAMWIYGLLGFPAGGAVGSAWASTTSKMVKLMTAIAAMVVYRQGRDISGSRSTRQMIAGVACRST